MVFASRPVDSASFLAARPVGAEGDAKFLGRENFDDAAYDRGLADARATGDNQGLLLSRLANGVLLGRGQFDAHFLLDPFERGGRVDSGQWMAPVAEVPQSPCDADLG